MRKFILLLSLLGSLALSTLAADEFTLNLSPVSPQSPTVAAMARQIECPVSPYTGIPDISIRLSGNLVGISINLCKSIQKELFINDTS